MKEVCHFILSIISLFFVIEFFEGHDSKILCFGVLAVYVFCCAVTFPKDYRDFRERFE